MACYKGHRHDDPDRERQGGSFNHIRFVYTLEDGSNRTGEIAVDDSLSLFGITVSETFEIQYDPRKPEKVYCADGRQVSDKFTVGFILILLYLLYSALHH